VLFQIAEMHKVVETRYFIDISSQRFAPSDSPDNFGAPCKTRISTHKETAPNPADFGITEGSHPGDSPPQSPSFFTSARSAVASSGRSSAKARLAARNPIFEPQSYVRPSKRTP